MNGCKWSAFYSLSLALTVALYAGYGFDILRMEGCLLVFISCKYHFNLSCTLFSYQNTMVHFTKLRLSVVSVDEKN